MVFNSYTFAIFFAVVLGLHNLPFSWRARITHRGGRVVFVQFPISGETLRMSDEFWPKSAYWDRFAERTSAEAIHFLDHPSLSGFECPDTSHLDHDQARIVTGVLLDILQDRGVLGEADHDR